jgi:soluble lytic murein transglycosylase-like protein
LRLKDPRVFSFQVVALFFLSGAIAKPAELPNSGSDAASAQLASVERQLGSLDIQRESVQKQLKAVSPAPHVTQFVARPISESVEIPISFPDLWDCPAISRSEVEGLIASAAKRESVPPELIRAVIKQESGFKPCAVSPKGAQGLMQLMPATAATLHIDDPFDPQQNIRGGAALLKQLLTRYGGDVRLALSAYNAGTQRVEEYGGVPGIFETQNYVSSILGSLTGEAPTEEIQSDEPTAPPMTHNVVLQLSLAPEQKPMSIHLTSGQ